MYLSILRFLCESGKSESERAGAQRVKAAAFNLIFRQVNLDFLFNIDF